MGYNVFITRKKDWTDEDGPIITLDEWKALVLSDSEMRLESGAEEQGVCAWTAYSKSGRRGNSLGCILMAEETLRQRILTEKFYLRCYESLSNLGQKFKAMNLNSMMPREGWCDLRDDL